jgi:hypothetical protein
MFVFLVVLLGRGRSFLLQTYNVDVVVVVVALVGVVSFVWLLLSGCSCKGIGLQGFHDGVGFEVQVIVYVKNKRLRLKVQPPSVYLQELDGGVSLQWCVSGCGCCCPCVAIDVAMSLVILLCL